MNLFTIVQPLPDVFHIQDAAGVCFTLIRGEKDTLLWDTGVGLYDVAKYVAPYVRGQLHVVLSHGHYDHACGQHYFSETFIHPEDLRLCKRCVDRKSRTAILKSIQSRGQIDATYPAERFLNGTPATVQPMKNFSLDLGNMDVQFILTPGHTAGSIVAYLPRRKLLLTGDMWNPQTWLFFKECQPLAIYVSSMKSIYDLDAEHVLRPHDAALSTMRRLRTYIEGLNEETFAAATPYPVPPYTRFSTHLCYPEPGSMLLFDADKLV